MENSVSRTKSDLTSTMLSVLKSINTRQPRRVTWGSQSVIFFEQSPVQLVQSQIPVTTKSERRIEEQVFDLREVFGDDIAPENSRVVRKRKKSCLDKDLILLIEGQKSEPNMDVKNIQLSKREKLETEDFDAEALTMGRESVSEKSQLPAKTETAKAFDDHHPSNQTESDYSKLFSRSTSEQEASRPVSEEFDLTVRGEQTRNSIQSQPEERTQEPMHLSKAQRSSMLKNRKSSTEEFSRLKESSLCLGSKQLAFIDIEEDLPLPQDSSSAPNFNRFQGLEEEQPAESASVLL